MGGGGEGRKEGTEVGGGGGGGGKDFLFELCVVFHILLKDLFF